MKALSFDSFWDAIGEHTPAEVAEVAEVEPRGNPPPDLKYLHEEVRQRLPTLTPGHRGVFDYWLEAYEENGWSREEAERGAFARTMGRGPMRLKAMGIWRDKPEDIRPIADAALRSAESGGTPGLIEPNEQ